MAPAKKSTSSDPKAEEQQYPAEGKSDEEQEAQLANITGSGGLAHDGPTQDDLNPAYAPNKLDDPSNVTEENDPAPEPDDKS